MVFLVNLLKLNMQLQGLVLGVKHATTRACTWCETCNYKDLYLVYFGKTLANKDLHKSIFADHATTWAYTDISL